ncbi:hypothetical protein HDU76_011797 [Blyttiomyces sp. JEL0837]|nr:hypothetical protein HDU76_011797 [Blyttiomyces sp. JEL0837]
MASTATTFLANASAYLLNNPLPSTVTTYIDDLHHTLESLLGIHIPLYAIYLIIISLIFFIINIELSRSPVRLTHATDTVPIPTWDFEANRVRNVPLHILIREKCAGLAKGSFHPTPYLFNGDLQTIFASLVAQIPDNRVTYEREILNMPDGGVVSIDWSPNPSSESFDQSRPLLVILHGLTGGSHETYVQDLVLESNKKNFNTVTVNFRGCANTELKSPQLYSGAYTDDIRGATNFIRKRFPFTPLFAVGFSLGANVLTKFVGEEGSHCPFLGFVSVANPFDLLTGSHALHRSWIGRNIYSNKMAVNLLRVYNMHRHLLANHPANLDESQISSVRSITDFDEAITRRLFGFRTVHEYYRMGSSAQYVPDITIPGLLLSALDDPVASLEAIPVYEVCANPNVVLATTAKGGHIGWFEGFFRPKRWFAKPVVEFLVALSEAHQSLPADVRVELEEEKQKRHSMEEPFKHSHYSHPDKKPISRITLTTETTSVATITDANNEVTEEVVRRTVEKEVLTDADNVVIEDERSGEQDGAGLTHTHESHTHHFHHHHHIHDHDKHNDEDHFCSHTDNNNDQVQLVQQQQQQQQQEQPKEQIQQDEDDTFESTTTKFMKLFRFVKVFFANDGHQDLNVRAFRGVSSLFVSLVVGYWLGSRRKTRALTL